MTFAASSARPSPGGGDQGGARPAHWRRPLRLFAAVLAAPFVAAAGILYVVLLPICGIASLLEGLLGAVWRWVRAGAHPEAPPARRAH